MHALKSWNMHFLHSLLVLLTCVWCAAFSLNVSPSYTTTLMLQAHARPCYTIISIINAQISLVPRLPLLVLRVMERRLPLNTPHSFTSKTTTWTQVISSATIRSGQEIDYTQAIPNCRGEGTSLKTPWEKLRTLNLASFPGCPPIVWFFVLWFVFSRSIHMEVPASVYYTDCKPKNQKK